MATSKKFKKVKVLVFGSKEMAPKVSITKKEKDTMYIVFNFTGKSVDININTTAEHNKVIIKDYALKKSLGEYSVPKTVIKKATELLVNEIKNGVKTAKGETTSLTIVPYCDDKVVFEDFFTSLSSEGTDALFKKMGTKGISALL
jgi:hypothetical protein